MGDPIYKILSKLTPLHQFEVVASKGMLEKDFKKTIKVLSIKNAEIIREHFSKYPEEIEQLNLDNLLYIYAKTGDNVYFTKFIQILDDGKPINDSIRDLIIEENLLDKFTDEQIKKIFNYSSYNKYIDAESTVKLAQYIDKISNQHYKELFQTMFDEAVKNIDYELWGSAYLEQIINKLSSEQLDEIISKMRVSELLKTKLSDERIHSAIEEKFKNNPNILDNYTDSLFVEFDRVKNLIDLLSSEGKLKFLASAGAMENMQYVEEMKTLVLSNPSLITSVSGTGTLAKFLNNFPYEQRLLLYENLPLDTLANLYAKKMDARDKAYLKRTINSNVNKLSDSDLICYLNNLTADEIFELFQNVDYLMCTASTVANILKQANTDEQKVLIINKIFNEKNPYIDYNYSQFWLSEVDPQDFNLFIKNASSNILLSCYVVKNDPSIENEIMNRFNTDSNIFGITPDASIILQNLSEENRLKVERTITENFKKNFDNTVLANLINSDYLGAAEKAKLNYALEKGYITLESMDLLASMYAKNPHVFKTLNIELLNPDIISIGPTFIEKLSKYPKNSLDVVKLYNSNPQIFRVFGEIVKTFEDIDSLNTYNAKLAIALRYFSNHLFSFAGSDIDFNNFTPSDCRNFFDYIVNNSNLLGVFTNDKIIYNYFDSNYRENYNNYLDDLFASATTIDEKKNVFLTKKYGLSTKEVSYLLTMFYDHISELNLSEGSEILDYFENIKRSFEIENIDQLNELYKGITESATDVLYMINEVRKAYTQTYLDALSDTEKMINNAMNGNTAFYDASDFTFDKLNGTAVVNYNGKEIPIISLVDNFSLILNSTKAFGGMDLVNNSYSDSWNLSERTTNHGICCVYVTPSHLGTAGVGEGGVLFGFYGFSNESLVTMAPYDMSSVNDNINTSSYRPPIFVSAEGISRIIRKTYPELVIERTELRPDVNSQYANIQPDYVVIFADWSDELKMTALKAASDFEKPIQVIYIDKVAVAKNESAKIDAMLQLFEENPGNLEYLESAINLHESNRTGFTFSKNALNVDEYFPTERITNAIDNWITSWTMLYQNEPSIEVRERLTERLETLKTILLDEQEKFDLGQFSTNSMTYLDFNISEIIGKIDQLIGVIKERTGGND